MAVYDLRKASKVSSGQKVISMGTDNSNLEKRVANIENKLDTLVNLILKLQKQKND